MISSIPWLRAAMTAALMLALGVTMHVMAGGPALPTVAVLPVIVLAVVGTRVAQGRPGSPGRVITLLLLGQVAVHLAMGPMSQTASAHVSHVMAPSPAAMTHAAMLRRSGEAFGPQVATAVLDSLACLFAHPDMLAAHIVAATAVGWWLAAGERRAERLADMVASSCARGTAVLAAPLPVPIPGTRSADVAIAMAPATPIRQLFLAAGTARRGPPTSI